MFPYLELEELWLNERERLAVDLDETLALLFEKLAICSETVSQYRPPTSNSYLAVGDSGSYIVRIIISIHISSVFFPALNRLTSKESTYPSSSCRSIARWEYWPW